MLMGSIEIWVFVGWFGFLKFLGWLDRVKIDFKRDLSLKLLLSGMEE